MFLREIVSDAGFAVDSPNLARMLRLRAGWELTYLLMQSDYDAWGDVFNSMGRTFVSATCDTLARRLESPARHLDMMVVAKLRAAYCSGNIVATLDAIIDVRRDCARAVL